MIGQHHPTVLFRVELRKPDSNPKRIAVARAIEAALCGAWHAALGVPLTVHRDCICEALPHYLRAAFDRDDSFWWDDMGNGYCTLRGARGRVLGTVWLTPLFPLLGEAAQ